MESGAVSGDVFETRLGLRVEPSERGAIVTVQGRAVSVDASELKALRDLLNDMFPIALSGRVSDLPPKAYGSDGVIAVLHCGLIYTGSHAPHTYMCGAQEWTCPGGYR